MSGAEKLMFVYGTLKRGGSNHHYLAGQKFIGEARTAPGFRLYDLGGYPGMIPRPDDREGVTGEVWSVDADALKHLDGLEGLEEGLYRRAVISLLPPFAKQRIEAYLYAQNAIGRREIGSTWKE
ncbi:MAG TPA: gamma-glutamylcyclotransferase family protein [Opitutaceae bacterium]|nr:gamma-glutamylcyclotransferase family protein [Opitutaceae bacterium]